MIVPVSCHFKATICRFLVTAHRLSTYLPSLLLRLPSSSSRVSSLRSLDFDLLFSPNHKACDHLHSSTFTHLWFFFFGPINFWIFFPDFIYSMVFGIGSLFGFLFMYILSSGYLILFLVFRESSFTFMWVIH